MSALWFCGWGLGAALAAPPQKELQAIAELEWARAEPVSLAAFLPGEASQRRVVARALGRLRSDDALSLLAELQSDPDPLVRLEAARALGYVPGAGPTIRAWLASEGMPRSLAERAAAEDGVVVALVGSLGFFGDPDDIDVLATLLAEPWPVGSAAARSLGRLGARKVPTVQRVVPALAARLSATDPRLVADAAWALSRVGMEGAGEVELAAVHHRLRGAAYERTRAWLVKAAWPHFDAAARNGLLIDLATDASRLVRVTLFSVLRSEDVEAEVVSSWLADPDPWVRLTVIDTLGRLGSSASTEALTRHAGRDIDAYELAAVVRAGGSAPEGAETSVIVRAAQTSAIADAASLIRIALDDAEPQVRTAAAGAMLDMALPPTDLGEQLLRAIDPAVREAGVGLIEGTPAANQVRVLVPAMAAERDEAVLTAGLTALGAAYAEPVPVKGPAKKLPTDGLVPLVDAQLKNPEPAVRRALQPLAALVGREVPPLERVAQRELILPSGDVVSLANRLPNLEEIGRVRAAVVRTTEGTFTMALDPASAPIAVWNFSRLADAGYFDDRVFHRVIPGFVAQTGCPRGDGWGGPGYTVPDEVSATPFDAGAVGMARAARDTGGSQWFVTTAEQPHLAGEYTRFGEVTEGLYVVKRLRPGSRVLSVLIERTPP